MIFLTIFLIKYSSQRILVLLGFEFFDGIVIPKTVLFLGKIKCIDVAFSAT